MEIIENYKTIGLTGFGDIGGKGKIMQITAQQCARAISNGQKTAEVCQRIANAETDDEKQSIKKSLRCVLFHAVYNGCRCAENAEALTGFVCLDYDDYDGDYDTLKKELSEDHILNPVLLFRSPRGKLKCVVFFEQLCGLKGDGKVLEFERWYKAAAGYAKNVYGLVCDTSCMDIARNCFLSHDPEPLCNPNGVCAVPLDASREREYEKLWAEMQANGKRKSNGTTYKAGVWTPELAERYGKDLQHYWNNLVVAPDGDWDYDRTKVIYNIGSRHKGTAKMEIAGLSGYEIKFRITNVACWLYGDKRVAQRWLEEHFPEARDHANWSPANDSNMKESPKLAMVRWVTRALRFKTKEPNNYGITKIRYIKTNRNK